MTHKPYYVCIECNAELDNSSRLYNYGTCPKCGHTVPGTICATEKRTRNERPHFWTRARLALWRRPMSDISAGLRMARDWAGMATTHSLETVDDGGLLQLRVDIGPGYAVTIPMALVTEESVMLGIERITAMVWEGMEW